MIEKKAWLLDNFTCKSGKNKCFETLQLYGNIKTIAQCDEEAKDKSKCFTYDIACKKKEIRLQKPTKEFSPKDKTYEVTKNNYDKFIFWEEEAKRKEIAYKKTQEYKRYEKENILKHIKNKDFMWIDEYVTSQRNIDFFDENILKALEGNSTEEPFFKISAAQIKYIKKHPNINIKMPIQIYDKKTKKTKLIMVAEHKNSWSKLMKAIRKRETNKINDLLKQNPNLNHVTNNGSTAIFFSAKENDVNTTKKLIKMGANVNHINNFGYTPLHVAIMSYSYKTALALINGGADVNIRTKNASEYSAFLIEAIKGKVNYDILNALIKHNANISDIRDTILLDKAFCCDDKFVKYILKHGANPNAKDQYGQTYKQIWGKKCK